MNTQVVERRKFTIIHLTITLAAVVTLLAVTAPFYHSYIGDWWKPPAFVVLTIYGGIALLVSAGLFWDDFRNDQSKDWIRSRAIGFVMLVGALIALLLAVAVVPPGWF